MQTRKTTDNSLVLLVFLCKPVLPLSSMFWGSSPARARVCVCAVILFFALFMRPALFFFPHWYLFCVSSVRISYRASPSFAPSSLRLPPPRHEPEERASSEAEVSSAGGPPPDLWGDIGTAAAVSPVLPKWFTTTRKHSRESFSLSPFRSRILIKIV